MTENEAIQVFKELLDVPCEMLVKYDSVANEEQKKALVKIRVSEEMAIQALEEIQQYRAIGTVEEFKALKDKNEPKELAEEYKNDFCEWEIVLDRDIHREYKPMCSEDGFIEMTGYFDYEFCHYCGKKIKVVE